MTFSLKTCFSPLQTLSPPQRLAATSCSNVPPTTLKQPPACMRTAQFCDRAPILRNKYSPSIRQLTPVLSSYSPKVMYVTWSLHPQRLLPAKRHQSLHDRRTVASKCSNHMIWSIVFSTTSIAIVSPSIPIPMTYPPPRQSTVTSTNCPL